MVFLSLVYSFLHQYLESSDLRSAGSDTIFKKTVGKMATQKSETW